VEKRRHATRWTGRARTHPPSKFALSLPADHGPRRLVASSKRLQSCRATWQRGSSFANPPRQVGRSPPRLPAAGASRLLSAACFDRYMRLTNACGLQAGSGARQRRRRVGGEAVTVVCQALQAADYSVSVSVGCSVLQELAVARLPSLLTCSPPVSRLPRPCWQLLCPCCLACPLSCQQ
jgi:hypothetical protein